MSGAATNNGDSSPPFQLVADGFAEGRQAQNKRQAPPGSLERCCRSSMSDMRDRASDMKDKAKSAARDATRNVKEDERRERFNKFAMQHGAGSAASA